MFDFERVLTVCFQSIDVDKALNEKKIIVDLDERTDFAAQLEEIESRVDDTQMDEAEINEDDIRLDPRMPREGRERFLRARCRVLQDEVNRLQKEYQLTNDKWHQARRQAQDRAEHITKEQGLETTHSYYIHMVFLQISHPGYPGYHIRQDLNFMTLNLFESWKKPMKNNAKILTSSKLVSLQ